jgi:hypothetical protein
MGGRTARGRGVETPILDRNDPEPVELVNCAQLAAGIAGLDPSLVTGYERPEFYYVLLNVAVESAKGPWEIDAVILERHQSSEQLKFHGLEVKVSNADKGLAGRLNRRTPFFDFLWVVTYESFADDIERDLPKHVGLITQQQGILKVKRTARSTPRAGKETGGLAKSLIPSLLRS